MGKKTTLNKLIFEPSRKLSKKKKSYHESMCVSHYRDYLNHILNKI